MTDYLIIDASRQPTQIRCLRCGFAQDLQLPMAIRDLAALERRITAEHRRCKPSPPPAPPAICFTEGPTARNNTGSGPTTPKPAIVPKAQPQFGGYQPRPQRRW